MNRSDYADRFFRTYQGKYFNPTFNRPDGSQEKKQGYYADVYTDWALDWLNKRDKKKPFCLNLHFKGPHAPFDYPDRWAKLHEGVKIPEPANLHEDVVKASPHLKALQYSMLYNKAASKIYHLQKPIGNTDEEKRSNSYQHMMHKYIRCVAAIDDNIKRVLDYLDAQGIKNNTVIVYTSDQGYWLGQHGFFDKRLILEETLKMPFIVRYPKEIKAGSACDDLAMNIDFGPTLLDFAGVTKPKPMQGVSLRPLLQGKTPTDWRNAIFYAYYARKPLHWGLRSSRYKLIHFPHTKEFEFYDLQKDPMEMTNVATDPTYAKQIATSEAQLDKLMDDVGVTRQFLLDHMKTRSRGKTKPNKPKSKKAKKKKNPGN